MTVRGARWVVVVGMRVWFGVGVWVSFSSFWLWRRFGRLLDGGCRRGWRFGSRLCPLQEGGGGRVWVVVVVGLAVGGLGNEMVHGPGLAGVRSVGLPVTGVWMLP